MSSDMFMFDEPYYPNLATTNLLSSDDISANFFTDPISALSDSSIDTIFQEFSDDQNTNTNNNFTTNSSLTTTTTTNTTQISAEVQSLDQIAHTLFSNSPPSHQLETLSIHQQQQQSQMGSLGNVLTNNNNNKNNNDNNNNYSVVSDSSVKTEDFHMGFDYPHGSYNSYFINNNNNYDATTNETMLKFMQRSYSSNSFDGKPSFWFQPKFNSLFEVQTFQPEIESSSFTNGQMRRVSSTGDLPVGRVCSSSASPLSGGGEGSNMEESNFKVGKYSAEERKERIDRYRAKRTQRNFNKTIKYACRKTLADNRPRIRGRFARNDETGEIPKPTCFNRYEDDDDLWVDNLQEEDEEGILGRRGGGRYLSNFGATHHFQYCGY